MLTPEEIQLRLKRSWITPTTSSAVSTQPKRTPIVYPGQKTTAPSSAGPSFLESAKNIITKRSGNLDTIADKYGMNKQGLASSVLQTAGEATGALTDIGMEGVKRVLPSWIKEPIKTGIKAVAGAEPVQDIAKGYSDWAEKHPEAAANLEATMNVGSVLPIEKLAGAGLKATGKTASMIGKGLEESATKKAANILKEHALNLVKPIETKATKLADVARTTETGKGILKKSIIEPTTKEKLMAKVVENVPGIHPEKTFQQNYNIIAEHSKSLADKLKKEVASYKISIPRQEMINTLKNAAKTLKNSPLIVGDAEKMANKLLSGAKSFIDRNPGTAEGLFQARKDFDSWVKSQKPTIFDAKSEGALQIANREIRNGFNDLLDKKIPGVGLKGKLSEQHHLLDAVANIAPKAAEEANTAIGRAFQKAKNVIGTRNEAFNTAAATLGLGGIAAGSAAFAGPAAAVGIPSFLIYKGGKAVLKPEFRNSVGKILNVIGATLKKTTNPIEIKSLNKANDELKKYLSDIQPGLSIKDVSNISDNLIKEASKYSSGKDFYQLSGAKINQELRNMGIKGEEQVSNWWKQNAKNVAKSDKLDYMMGHRPSISGPGHNIAETGAIPKDVYTNPEYYFNMKDKSYQESYNVLKKIKDNANADVVIYRAGPKNEFNKGDWISLSPTYAKGESQLEKTKVWKKTVKAKDIQFAGDDINEFGYYPTN